MPLSTTTHPNAISKAEEAQLSRTRASTNVPSGASTKIRHVISRELDVSPGVALTDAVLTAGICVQAAVGGGGSLFSTWSRV